MVVCALCAVMLLAASCARTDVGRLVIETRDGPVAFTVELVDTPETRNRGLMFRNELAEQHGMLFDFREVRPVDMWMKNTLIPLDMLFVRADGTIHHIAANAEPLSTRVIPSQGPVLAVFEIGGGEARRLGIAVGDTMRHPIFGNAE